MNYLLKEAIVNNVTISYYVKDNQAKSTILFIHGYNSSSDFVSGIFNLKQNFNIIAINLPGSYYLKKPKRNLSIDYFNEIVETFINKYIKRHHLILLGHSLGGGTVAPLSQIKKVKRVIYLSTIHPRMIESKSWKKLKKFYDNKTLSGGAKNDIEVKPELDEIFDKSTLFADITKKYLLNKNYVTKKLLLQYQKSLNKKPLFIIGEKDYVIETKHFIDFVTNDLKQKVIVLSNLNHSPIKESPQEFNNWLNKNINYRKRWFKKSIIK